MDEKDIEQLQKELAEYKAKTVDSKDKVMALLTQGKAIGCKRVTHVIGDFEFDTISFIPKDVGNKFFNTIKDLDKTAEDDFDLNKVTETYAELLAELCVDEELKDKEVWVKFNDVSGALIPLGNSLIKELTVSDKELESFRKK